MILITEKNNCSKAGHSLETNKNMLECCNNANCYCKNSLKNSNGSNHNINTNNIFSEARHSSETNIDMLECCNNGNCSCENCSKVSLQFIATQISIVLQPDMAQTLIPC